MTDKKTTKTEKQAAKKPTTELTDDQLEEVQGGEPIVLRKRIDKATPLIAK